MSEAVGLQQGDLDLDAGVLRVRGKGLPAGSKQLDSDFGEPGWGGPCPPAGHGPHHYVFTVYALPTETLGLPANARTAFVGFTVNSKALAKATLTATYGR